LVRTGRL